MDGDDVERVKVLKILAGNTNLYEDVLEKFNSQVNPSSRIVMTSNNVEEVLTEVSVKPFFSKYYVVTVFVRGLDYRTIQEIIKISKEDHVKMALVCGSRKEYELFEGVEESVSLNCYRLSNNILNHYLTKRIEYNIGGNLLKEFRGRIKGRYDLTDYYIEVINREKPLTVTQLRRLVPKYNVIGFEQLFINMMKRENIKKSFELIDDYTFGLHYLHKQIKSMTDKLDKLYWEFYNGKLNRNNRREWYSNNGKDWKLREYYLEKYIEIMEEVSYDEFIMIKEEIEKVGTDRYQIYELYYRLFKREWIGGLNIG